VVPNYDEILDFDGMIKKCKDPKIQVGYSGGRKALEEKIGKQGRLWAKGRRWKVRDRKTNKGAIIKRNWISCDEMLKLLLDEEQT